ncbi:DNA cytosine methyltransferase [Ensifer adhaerens]|uniref:DNA cytosine methyltransferase n=1 Tax=Ensifer adhaerens TaxID=106592 RepID=UPI001F35CB65|nr:DNA cytosine methyltransferase [Ensifer adhaerens]
MGGWSYALRLAGWSDDREVWSGSCPCQPLSSAGQHKGHADERHLWPAFLRLISERNPPVVFGEQVANEDGREWLSAVRADLEAVGYACGAADLCAAGVGAPHARQRLFWVADPQGQRGRGRKGVAPRSCEALGGSSSAIRNEPWPDGRGSGSTLTVSDVLSPSYGVPQRVGQLRAYGNAIVPQVAAEVIGAYMEIAA